MEKKIYARRNFASIQWTNQPPHFIFPLKRNLEYAVKRKSVQNALVSIVSNAFYCALYVEKSS